MSTIHEEAKVEALCRWAARSILLDGRIPLSADAYRPDVLRVLRGDVGPSILDRVIVEGLGLWDEGRKFAESVLVGYSITIRGDAHEVHVEGSHSPKFEATVRAVVEAAIGAARAA